jgi:hypothetical protein
MMPIFGMSIFTEREMKSKAMKQEEEASVREAMRAVLSAEQQLKILAQRPGKSKRETARLLKEIK